MLIAISMVYGAFFSLCFIQHLLFANGLSFQKDILRLMSITLPAVGIICLIILMPYLIIGTPIKGHLSWKNKGFCIIRLAGIVLLVLLPLLFAWLSPVFREAVRQSSCIELHSMTHDTVLVISNPTGSEWHIDKYRYINRFIRSNRAFDSGIISDCEYRELIHE